MSHSTARRRGSAGGGRKAPGGLQCGPFRRCSSCWQPPAGPPPCPPPPGPIRETSASGTRSSFCATKAGSASPSPPGRFPGPTSPAPWSGSTRRHWSRPHARRTCASGGGSGGRRAGAGGRRSFPCAAPHAPSTTGGSRTRRVSVSRPVPPRSGWATAPPSACASPWSPTPPTAAACAGTAATPGSPSATGCSRSARSRAGGARAGTAASSSRPTRARCRRSPSSASTASPSPGPCCAGWGRGASSSSPACWRRGGPCRMRCSRACGSPSARIPPWRSACRARPNGEGGAGPGISTPS